MQANIEQKVKDLLMEVLALDDSEVEVTVDSHLVDDLAAESIDFIDICFRLEREFNIGKVTTNDIFPTVFNGERNFDENKVNEEFKKYPHINGDLLDEIKKNKSFKPLLKVKNLVQFVDWKLTNV